jgi:hypothetical protein
MASNKKKLFSVTGEPMTTATAPDLVIRWPLHHESDDCGGPIMSCLECRETAHSRWGFTEVYLLYSLYCGECLTEFLRKDDMRPLRKKAS